MVQSRKGKRGGYLLARDPSRIPVGQVVRLFDGPLAPVPCASQTGYVRCDDCADEAACGVRLAMKEVRDATARILDKMSLATLARRELAASGPGGGLGAEAAYALLYYPTKPLDLIGVI
jgi:Rrf2 family protein